MTIVRFIMTRTLKDVCKGNHSECARKLSMDYSTLRKLMRRIENGGSSARLVEALLEMYWREELSLDEALRDYSETRMGEDLESAEKNCEELYQDIQEKVNTGAEDTKNIAAILKVTQDLGKIIHREYCQKYCDPLRVAQEECALRRYNDFVDQLKKELGNVTV